jgi:hypothetical protein
MNAGQSLIEYYNRLNGHQLSVTKLKEFHQKVQRFLDSVGHGPFVKDLKGIMERASKALKDAPVNGVFEKVELVPIDTNKFTGKILRVASGHESKPEVKVKVKVVKPDNVVAEEIKINSIHVDTTRFQNRQDAFSEASANSVAENFDPNKFDPIVVWRDPEAKKIFVLSGHSRFEGMKRRKSKTVAVRYFEGNEEEAIRFAKVEANRGATQETLIEDLAAFRMMRDGDASRGIKKLSKSELQKIFKGKVQKLEAYSHLAPGGLFVNALSQPTTSNYPYLERNAQWVGQVRKDHAVITNSAEDNIFHFFYSDKSGKHLKLSKDEFFKLVGRKINQLTKDENILFPECGTDGCKTLNDKESDPIKGESYRRIREINETLSSVREKLTSKDRKVRVNTEDERKYLTNDLVPKLQEELERIQRDLNLMDKTQASLFGIKRKKRKKKKHKLGAMRPRKQAEMFDVQRSDKPVDKLLQERALQDAIKAGSTVKIGKASKARNKGFTDTPLFAAKSAEAQGRLFGVVAADAIAGLTFTEIPLDGEWKTAFHRLFADTQAMFWGSPGSGKTVKQLQFAQYLASSKDIPTLYVAHEEMGRSTFTEKIREFNIGHPNLRFAKELPTDLSPYKAIFLDSVQSLGMDLEKYKEWRDQNADKIRVLILQTTKDGDFRGGREWEHEMDIAGEVVNRKIIFSKNRLDPNFKAKADQIELDEEIKATEKKQLIKQKVKNTMAQPEPKI